MTKYECKPEKCDELTCPDDCEASRRDHESDKWKRRYLILSPEFVVDILGRLFGDWSFSAVELLPDDIRFVDSVFDYQTGRLFVSFASSSFETSGQTRFEFTEDRDTKTIVGRFEHLPPDEGLRAHPFAGGEVADCQICGEGRCNYLHQ